MRRTIRDVFPEPELLLSLAAEELAFPLLELAKEQMQNGMVLRDNVLSVLRGTGSTAERISPFPPEAGLAVTEAWVWLEVNLFLVPADGTNGAHGFRVLGRRAFQIRTEDQFKQFRDAAAFPKSLLHPAIADKVWVSLARGDFEDAVFAAFKAVEIAVRRAANLPDTLVGVGLMRKAFDKESGPLTDMTQPEPEREALAHLFAGAIGSYKNPHSHRTVTINEMKEAQEQVVIASHLLRIVDARDRPL
jgi:uncharacterized protein (TIGR02391 family)